MAALDGDPIVPDDKDWTWVLARPCPDCGFDSATFDHREVGDLVRANRDRWGPLLEHPDVARRPDPATWSALEYACHVRDVFELFERRLGWMLGQDDPLFDNWDQDVTAVAERYGEQDPTVVAAQLQRAGTAVADAFDAVDEGGWDRTGRRSDGAAFTVATFARYFIHDPVHHLWDVERGYATLAGRPS